MHQILKDINPSELLLFLFFFTLIIQGLFWLLIFSRLSFYWKSRKVTKEHNLPLSIIICAKNEAQNLENNLPIILNQSYDNFEIIIVDDGSEDDTNELISMMQKKHSKLRKVTLIQTEKKYLGKKEALTKGIQYSTNELLLLTDADCFPSSSLWAKKMTSSLTEDKAIVIAYAPLLNTGGFLNAFFRFETLMVAIQYLSYALCRLPYMGVGRNLLYKKHLFQKVGGFKSHIEIPSGDDDLFISEVATNNNVAVCLDQESFMYSKAPDSLKQFISQKTRQINTSKYYKKITQVYLLVWSMSLMLFYICFFYFLFCEFRLAIFIYALRCLYVSFFMYPIMRKLKELSLFILWPVYEFLLVIYFAIIAPLSFFIKVPKWK